MENMLSGGVRDSPEEPRDRGSKNWLIFETAQIDFVV